MSGLNLLLAIMGSGITLTVAVAMVLITRGGTEAHVQTNLDQTPNAARDPADDRPPVSAAR